MGTTYVFFGGGGGGLGVFSQRRLLPVALGRVGLGPWSPGPLLPWSFGPLVPPHNSFIQNKSKCCVLVCATW